MEDRTGCSVCSQLPLESQSSSPPRRVHRWISFAAGGIWEAEQLRKTAEAEQMRKMAEAVEAFCERETPFFPVTISPLDSPIDDLLKDVLFSKFLVNPDEASANFV